MQWAIRAGVLALGLIGVAVAAQPKAKPPAAPPPVQVMVLGTYHFGNPGLDINNMKADSVLTPQRQAELQRVAEAILAFRPTRVMVERQSNEPGFAVPDYATFDAAMLASRANETVQIGYRIARLAGLTAVQGIDEQPGPGEPDYFPYGKLEATAQRLGQTPVLERLNGEVGAWLKDFEAAQKTSSVGQLLARMNDPNGLQGKMDYYYGALGIGDRDDQSGADLNAMWYLRNAKIFGKLMQASQPGDRVLVIYGSGHLFWLRHFARHTPGYVDVDAMPYLKKAR
ncbi:DUF5694 domain-containing protein [Sandarakinorhabdus oryzae]|uniref:DUF5694 domain-containing protein n=1 Tax=Sandarakinorhabdus oryzae TaxID=2675220 RepID=UPI0012E1EFDE|nr:DUF5694 domain-containing protein [Sandarakinorhabdus oryzae]